MTGEENGGLGSSFSLEEILAEAKALNNHVAQNDEKTEPVKRWSAQDIDRLLLATQKSSKLNGEEMQQENQPAEPDQTPENRPEAEPAFGSSKDSFERVSLDLSRYEVPQEKMTEIPEPMQADMWQPEPESPPAFSISKDSMESFDIDLSDFDFPEPAAEGSFDPAILEDINLPEEKTPDLKLYKEITGCFKIDFSSLEEEEPQDKEKPVPPRTDLSSTAEEPDDQAQEESKTKPAISYNTKINITASDIFSRPSPPEFDTDIEPLPELSGSSGGMETDEIRERFLSILELEKTAEHDIYRPEDPIEKPGIILGKSQFSKTGDLLAMPTVIPAEEALRAALLSQQKTTVNNRAADEKENNQIVDGQIVLTGFEEKETETEKVSEIAVEGALQIRRKEKARNFKLAGIPDEADESAHFSADFDKNDSMSGEPESGQKETSKNKRLEYHFPEQKNRVFKSIKKACKKATFSVIALTITELAFVLLMFVPFLLKAASIDAATLNAGGNGYLLISLLLVTVAAFLNMPCILSGLKAIIRLKPNSDAAAALAVFLAFIQNLLLLFLPQARVKAAAVYSSAAVFALLLNALGRRFSHACALGNFEFCAFTSPASLYSINEIENSSEAFEIGRGILMGNPDVLYSSKAEFPSGFIENALDGGIAETISRTLFPIATGISAIIGVIVWILAKSFFPGLTIFTGALCLSVPACAVLTSSFQLRAVNKKLNASGAMIANWNSAEKCSKTNAVVIDSADLFDRAHCEMHGMKDYKNVRIDDVILYTAAMIIKSGGPLTDVFDKVIVDRRELLPPVKSLSYEDRLGLSAWIHGQKVLLGNRNLLVHHDIEVPPKTSEERYKHDGRRVMYLAIANKIAAMFVVSYTADSSLIPYIKKLEDDGIQLLVRTCDANVTEDLLSDCLDLPVNGIKVIGATAGRIFKRYRDKVKYSAPARVLHNGSALSLLKSISAASNLSFGIRMAELIQIIGVGLGLLALLVLACLSSFNIIGAAHIILFQAFWALISLAVSRLKK